jgi:hypothetical protein
MAGNNKKAVLFTIDEEIYKELRYQKTNMSGHVNYLLRKSLFEVEDTTIMEAKPTQLAAALMARNDDDSLNTLLLKFIQDHK